MATIALYAGKINNMPGLIKDVRKSVEKYNKELAGLYQKTLKVDGSVCDLGEVMDSLRASSQIQEQRIEILENFQENSEDFIQDTIRIDNNVADTVDQNKDDFYDKYDYLKPDCEKSGWECFWEDVGAWCKEHWKAIATIIIVIAAIAIIVVTGGTAAGPIAALLLAMAKGALVGAAIGAASGGILSLLTGKSFWEGVENGAFSGAISGIITAGMGFGLSHAGKAALGFAKTVLIGGTSGAGTSIISDLGDILFANKDISLLQLLKNAAISGLTSAALSALGYGISKGISALKSYFRSKVTPLENGPYIKDGKPNGRPKLSGEKELQFEKELYNKQVGKDGILRDPNTGEVIDWKPGDPRKGIVDFGHKAGKNYDIMFQKYKYKEITLEELKAFQFNPSNYRLEAPSPNRSHLFEKSFLQLFIDFPFSSSAGKPLSDALFGN